MMAEELAQLQAMTKPHTEPAPGMPQGSFWKPERVAARRKAIAVIRGRHVG